MPVQHDDDGDLGGVPPQPEPGFAAECDPRTPIPPVPDDEDVVFGPGRAVDPRSLTADEARALFDQLLDGFVAEEHLEVTMSDILGRWRFRSRPWIVDELARRAELGQVERVPQGRFQSCFYRINTPVAAAPNGKVSPI